MHLFVGREVIRKLYIRIISIFCCCKSRGKIRWMFAHYFEGDIAFRASI
jgi:hypothetical protein